MGYSILDNTRGNVYYFDTGFIQFNTLIPVCRLIPDSTLG